jgi:DNA polymerase-3 subunit gamma/tau
MRAQPVPANQPAEAGPVSFEEMVQLFSDKKEGVIAAQLLSAVHLVKFEPGRIEFRLDPNIPNDLATRVSRLLGEWTGRPWLVSLSREAGQATLREQRLERELKRKADAVQHPLVQAILEAFPGATIEAVRDTAGETDAAAGPSFADPDPANGEEE